MRRIEMPKALVNDEESLTRHGIIIRTDGRLWIGQDLYANWCDQVGMHLTVVSEFALIRFFDEQAQENQLHETD
ncbi:hypothetical protein LCGC14_1685240 [marine sediment metagenome]|uniref:Uncharacterized protein n=1 Tax=marine sediment metagenome TaxID=412755 RepID=A0A0F9IA09_9ZZZZ